MNPIRWFVILALMAAVCALEVFLAKRKSRWPGLVMPLLALFPALFVLPNLLTNALSVAENGLQALLSLLAMLLLFVPALVLLAVYWFCRRRRKRREDVEKMKIQDL
ncbi:hypothetical protein [Agathobaculum sp.]|uniref:hypothetical protein n=1 Tax=Agathobaculum sp. TaxID=2048138 RepID=UPI0039A2B0AE